MITCIAIDDEPNALDVISIHAGQIDKLRLIKSFTNPFLGLEYLRNHIVDVLFIDINMPGLSGIELIKKLKVPPLIIFTTAYSSYVVDSYDHQAVDYLLKPIEFDRFYKSVEKTQRLLNARIPKNEITHSEYFFVKDGYKQVKVTFEEILYVKSQGNYLDIQTKNNKAIARMTFLELTQQFPKNLLFRVHNSYMVNIKQIDRIEDNQIYIADARIPIGTIYRDAFINRINQ